MLATLLGSNLRRGPHIEAYSKAGMLRVYEEKPPAGWAPT
jgi:hypothetical protein